MIQSDTKFDAIFCGNDLIAIGALKALRENDIKVPQDVGVIGFDDIYMAQMLDPELTTVAQPNYEMGYQSAEMLIDMVENKVKEAKPIVLTTKLVVRKSTR